MSSKYSFLSFTEVSDIEQNVLLEDGSSVTVPDSGEASQSGSSTDTELLEDVPATETLENNTESSLVPLTESEVVTEVVYMTGEYDADILTQLKVTNNLMGIMLALQIFLLAFIFLSFFIRIIKDNVTNLFT